MTTTIASNLAAVKESIGKAREAALSPADDVELVAISKQQPEDRIRAALDAGHRVFGENRVQEAAGRWPGFRETFAGVQLHLIGPLQSNKAREAVALFDVIETVDREKIARVLAKEMASQDRALPCLVQVNTGKEPQKSGIDPEETEGFVRLCQNDIGLPVKGLMCIPPIDEEPAMHFALLAELGKGCGLPWLSMGMSGDFETAIRFGATHVRVGTAVFGDRG